MQHEEKVQASYDGRPQGRDTAAARLFKKLMQHMHAKPQQAAWHRRMILHTNKEPRHSDTNAGPQSFSNEIVRGIGWR